MFSEAVDALADAGIPCLLHGAMAMAAYTGHWRNTKDVDVIVRPSDRDRAVAVTTATGFDDYYDQLAYDRSWIYRACRQGVIFDLIWALPNHRVEIDDNWFTRATNIAVRERVFAVVPAEELIRVKLYVMQRERCDWVDVLNVMAATANFLDWDWLVHRMGHDLALLHGALAVFNWLCPGRAHALPAAVRKRFALVPAAGDDLGQTEENHVRLLDSRPWFALHQPMDVPLER